jgi:hypothetical protein
VILALGGGVLNQVGVGELRRGDQHGSRDRDGIVEGELAHQLGRRVRQSGQPLREPFARLVLDFGRELNEHVVEQRDLRT